MHAPKIGLSLIRQIVLHTCTFGRETPSTSGDDAVVIEFDDGPRRIPFVRSYFWSRDAQGLYCVTSALMALEAWGHYRIDAGDDIGAVISDILGDDEVPAAYLLVIVDLLLSHWPESRKAAIPFVGSPQLLAWDRQRQTHDQMNFDLGMFGRKEPRGLASRESLRKRGSRGALLERTLPYYLFSEPKEDGNAVRVRLEKVAERLGPYESNSSFADPRFMVRYALNQLDATNYQAPNSEGRRRNRANWPAVVSPADEANDLAPLQEQVARNMTGTSLRAELSRALEKPGKILCAISSAAASPGREISMRAAKPNPILIIPF